jgi:hypothetical protein
VAYHEVRLWRIEGTVDVAALRVALHAVTVHQPMLRTRFVVGADGPVQIVDAMAVVALEETDLRGDSSDPGTTPRGRPCGSVRHDRSTLRSGPPLRWTLFRALMPIALPSCWFGITSWATDGRGVSSAAKSPEAYANACANRDPAFPLPGGRFR